MKTKITSLLATKKSKIVAGVLAVALITGGAVAITNVVSADTVWAVLLSYFGKADVTGNVWQSVLLDGGRYNAGDDTRVQSFTTSDIFAGETSQSNHTLENRSSVVQTVGLATTDSTGITGAITTSYFRNLEYNYSVNHVGVDVTVTDEGDSLKWTYAPTDGVINAMTVSINYGTEDVFEIWTDDGHGWPAGFSYGDSSDDTTVVDANSVDGIIASEWSVSIRKDLLGSAFKWHGYANYNSSEVWINGNELGTGCSNPLIEATIREELSDPVILQPNETIDFVMSNETIGALVCQGCTVTLTVNPQ